MGQILLKYKCTHYNGTCDIDMSIDHGLACKHGPCGELTSITLTKLKYIFPNTWKYIQQDDNKIKDLYNVLNQKTDTDTDSLVLLTMYESLPPQRVDVGGAPKPIEDFIKDYLLSVRLYPKYHQLQKGKHIDNLAFETVNYNKGEDETETQKKIDKAKITKQLISYLNIWLDLIKSDFDNSYTNYLVDIKQNELWPARSRPANPDHPALPQHIGYKNNIIYSLYADIINQFDHAKDNTPGNNTKEHIDTLTGTQKRYLDGKNDFKEAFKKIVKNITSNELETIFDGEKNLDELKKHINKDFSWVLFDLIFLENKIDFITIINKSKNDSKKKLVDIIKCSSHIFSCMYTVNRNDITKSENLDGKYKSLKLILSRKCYLENNGKDTVGDMYLNYPRIINSKATPGWYKWALTGLEVTNKSNPVFSDIDKNKCSKGDMFQIEKNIAHLRDRDLCTAIKNDDIDLFIEMLNLTERDKYPERLLVYNYPSNTILHEIVYWEARKCFLHVITFILPNTTKLLDSINQDGNTALHIACYKGQMYFIVTMIKIGANLDIINNKQETLLHMAVRSGMLNIVKYIYNNDTVLKLSYKNNTYKTPLHLACVIDNKPENELSIIRFLVNKGSDLINWRTEGKKTIISDLDNLGQTQVNLLFKTIKKKKFYDTYNGTGETYTKFINAHPEYHPTGKNPIKYQTIDDFHEKNKNELSYKEIIPKKKDPPIERKSIFSMFDSPENYLKIIPIIIVSIVILVIIYKHFL